MPLSPKKRIEAEMVDDHDLPESEFRAVITSDSPDRHGTSVDPAGLDVQAFRQNPVLLFQHESGALPIGKVLELEVFDDRIEARFRVDGDTDLERTIIKKLNAGSLRGISIGFRPNPDQMEERDDGIVEIKEAELVETSVVTLGSNPDAIVTERSIVQDHADQKGVYTCREGKVLSERNQNKLQKARQMIKDVLEDADRSFDAIHVQKREIEDMAGEEALRNRIDALEQRIETLEAFDDKGGEKERSEEPGHTTTFKGESCEQNSCDRDSNEEPLDVIYKALSTEPKQD